MRPPPEHPAYRPLVASLLCLALFMLPPALNLSTAAGSPPGPAQTAAALVASPAQTSPGAEADSAVAADSSRAAPTPLYKKKGVLIGAAVALVGVLALVLSGGSDDGGTGPGNTDLPGFPPPPSSQR